MRAITHTNAVDVDGMSWDSPSSQIIIILQVINIISHSNSCWKLDVNQKGVLYANQSNATDRKCNSQDALHNQMQFPFLFLFELQLRFPLIECLLFAHFQVQLSDRMSNRICHACISFLNSWQSFKNRCNAAQKKQQTFLDIFLAKERAKKTVDIQMAAERQRQLQTQRALASAQQQRILKTALTQSMNSTPYNTSNNSSVDVVCLCCSFPF